ncbi:hypothetical protein ACHAPA_000241 [Fusarium lateritium]
MDPCGNYYGTAAENSTTRKRSSSQAPALEDRLASETHLRRFTENVLDSRQQEIENRESEKDRLAARVEALERQLAGTQRQLAEAQDQVFRLQPSRRDITESEARDAYRTLFGNVQRWVENRAGYVIEDLETGRLNDIAQCREWRSETLTALTNQAVFKARRQRHLNIVTEDLASLLSAVAPRTPVAELHSSIRRSIVEPAADLVHQLHLASSIFSLKWTARTAATRLENYQCLNLANAGMVLDLSGTKPTSPVRRNVTYLFDVAPGLFVERIEGGRKLGMKAVVKPTVLIDNAEGGVSQAPTVMRWLWDNAPAALGTNRSASRASSRRPAASVVSASGRPRY